MKKHFPLHYTLESGTEVVVTHSTGHVYNLTLKSKSGAESSFSYNDDEVFTEQMENALTFDQLNALRRFWLEQEKEELS